jgi:hypothetical protein
MEQPSPLEPHGSHVAPAGAHAIAEVSVQTFPAQHPPGHEVALQTHTPPEQTCPAAHAVALPHVHVPPEEQPSAVAPHGEQVPPPAPHSAVDGVRHCEPLQQPVEQVVALQLAQLPPLQKGCEPVHTWHAPPPDPHRVLVLPPSHWLPLQHPLHDVASQTHAPPEQCWPVVQGEPVPHVHWPVVAEQLSDDAPHGEQSSP